jgi:hypothetical protein
VILVDMDGILVKEPSREHEEEKRRKLSRKGANKFPGKLIHFGQPPFENWSKVLDNLG